MAKKNCYFCAGNAEINIEDANSEILKRFLDPQSKILSAKKTGVCAKHQRKLSKAIKHTRIIGLLPFVSR